jgi:hypothetical protein
MSMNLSNPRELASLLEAFLFASGKPQSLERLYELFEEAERPEPAVFKKALERLRQSCEGRAFELVEVASGYRLQVRETYAPWVGRLWEERPQRYSRAMLETLALIAYRQPITRGGLLADFRATNGRMREPQRHFMPAFGEHFDLHAGLDVHHVLADRRLAVDLGDQSADRRLVFFDLFGGVAGRLPHALEFVVGDENAAAFFLEERAELRIGNIDRLFPQRLLALGRGDLLRRRLRRLRLLRRKVRRVVE